MAEHEIAIFSPIPPEQNGIADYTYHLVAAMRHVVPCAVYANQPDGSLPDGVPIREPLQAFRHLRPETAILHQVGNNPGHIFVLDALRKWGGVTTLHDQNLHYLYEVSHAPKSLLSRIMRDSSDRLGAVFARQWFENGTKTGANYALFDMLGEVLSRSTAVIVHSRFAKNRIRLLYGAEAAENVHVVPHLALPPDNRTDDFLHGVLKIPDGVPLIMTSGFATFAKRFDWLVAALDEIASRGAGFFWVHAGKERPEEYDLSGLLERYPEVKRRSCITGYLSEEQLNECIAACDVLINLRYPSVGESSGTLARAMAAGRCCVVNSTASYADLPPGSVLHVPVMGAVPALVEGLECLLRAPELRAAYGGRALALARGEWAPEAVARAYAGIMAEFGVRLEGATAPRPTGTPLLSFPIDAAALRQEIEQHVRGCTGNVEIRLSASSPEQLARISMQTPLLFADVLPQDLQIHAVTVEQDNTKPRGRDAEDAPGVALVLKGVLG